jgi:DNA-binding SARP family transcriptional activator/ABC-type branched-subunit amino acid transport system substrate-binding protein/DNA-binding beta-propeller fold protein YncE
MDFRVLGPLEVEAEGRPLNLGGPRQRALLALLLLNANEVVSRDRIVDELWGDEPPPSAVKTVQANVSRLRTALGTNGDARIETHGHGYSLRVADGELDADRFQALLEQARANLADERPEVAAERLREALGLWHGPALADLPRNHFAQAEIGRLEELRLVALEDRIEADLELGQDAALVGELEGLVADHPLRERLRGQLMLALYRSGRQAEALAVYQRARHELAEELGLEPGSDLRELEGRILEHDPSLTRPARPRPRMLSSPRSRALLLAGLVLAAAVVVAVFQLVREGGAESGDDPEDDAPGVRALDPGTGELTASVPLGSSPAGIAFGEGGVWVLDADDRTISRVDPSGRSRVRTFSTASTPTGIAAGAGAVWVGNAFRDSGFAGTSYPESVSRLDPDSGEIEATIQLPAPTAHPYFQGGGFNKHQLAATADALWAVNTDESLSRIDPRTNQVVARVRGVRAEDLAAGPGGVWATETRAGDTGGIVRIDPETNAPAQRIAVAAESLVAPAVGGGSVWLADPIGGSVWRVVPGPDPLLRQIPLDVGVHALAFGEGALWATNEVADRVYRIDPRTNRASVVMRTPAPQQVTTGAGTVWFTSLGPPSGRETLPGAACEPAIPAGRAPDVLLVSDLPLQGDARAITRPMADAIAQTLRERGFRAGPHTVGYRSCDVSTAQAGGTDILRCFGNGKGYARDLEVVGVIGSFHSFCSSVQIPITNQAAEGPLAMLSPSNTVVGLTRPYRGMRRGELRALYPSGERSFFRIAAADHLAPVAMVEAAEGLGARRPFVAWDRDDDDTAAFADQMRRAIRERGLELAGAQGWDPEATRFQRFATEVAAARPDAVLMTGAAPPHQDALIRDLRDALGADTKLIASDGFAGLTFGGAPFAEGMFVANYGVPNSELPPAGRRFLERFAHGRPDDGGPDGSSAYGAQAAAILLDAIARSDGTRASVNRELRRTRVEDGILGDISFDRFGDPVEAPVTIYRITRDGAVVHRVVWVSALAR